MRFREQKKYNKKPKLKIPLTRGWKCKSGMMVVVLPCLLVSDRQDSPATWPAHSGSPETRQRELVIWNEKGSVPELWRFEMNPYHHWITDPDPDPAIFFNGFFCLLFCKCTCHENFTKLMKARFFLIFFIFHERIRVLANKNKSGSRRPKKFTDPTGPENWK
jgi:hypothetical protein